MTPFERELKRLDDFLSSSRTDYYKQLKPGASPEALAGFEQQFRIVLPPEFKSLYQWRNGQPDSVSEALYDNWMFRSLEDVANTKSMCDGMIGYDFDDPRWWRRSWVPFMMNYGGDSLCLDLQGEDFGNPGQLIVFWHDWGSREPAYLSMQDWVERIVKQIARDDDQSRLGD